ncbi:glutathione S-transferase domain-containing protein [Hypoxylon trugodes]|uniref:glutathione S-transferase domain-containing protein n=1 Tax=Hypoxylon trugodes TaxID=326681 RepID=UPI00219EB647|nr:glutathione S-transferase domain-containing protein [Hypoxylon trugodes]KAI1383733.1 glutathione S-transferase domain-containing protein [Hypoxylon trugodes]
MATPKIILYTNHGCPWAHRAHIALAELKLPFEEKIIDLTVPRTPEYLKINPRGLVPALSFNSEILTESSVVSNFLADAYPSHLLPASNEPGAALLRARIAFFADTFISKLNGIFFKAQFAKTDAEAESFANEYVDVAVKELEPLLGNAAPFFNGSDKLTQAEVLTGSFALRLFTLPKHGVVPEHILTDLSTKAPNFYRWVEAVSKHPSVTGIYNEEAVVAWAKKRAALARASA